MDTRDELRVIHALRLKGFASSDIIAQTASIPVENVSTALEELTESGAVRFKAGTMTGYSLMPQGRQRGEQLLAAQLDAHGCRAEMQAAYGHFLALNRPFLELCTRWQTRTLDGELGVNDHTDRTYDDSIIAELVDTHDLMVPVCRELHELLDRFESYETRFEHALVAVRNGDTQWFTKPIIDSYHSVWFELHEDLLATLGIDRSQEGQQ